MAGLYTKGYVRKLTRRFSITPIKLAAFHLSQTSVHPRTNGHGSLCLETFLPEYVLPLGNSRANENRG